MVTPGGIATLAALAHYDPGLIRQIASGRTDLHPILTRPKSPNETQAQIAVRDRYAKALEAVEKQIGTNWKDPDAVTFFERLWGQVRLPNGRDDEEHKTEPGKSPTLGQA